MTAKAPDYHLEDAIRDYLAGATIMATAPRYRMSTKRLADEIKRRGLFRGHSGRTKTLMIDIPGAEVVARYIGGESVKDLARVFGVSRGTIDKRLAREGVPIRTMAESIRLGFSRMTPEDRKRFSEPSHLAMRGKPKSFEHKCKIAATRQARQIGASSAELLLQIWLRDRGIEAVPQLAIGPYNADIGTDSVVVELFGGNWHGYGRHKRRTTQRYRHILDSGRSVVVVWVNARRGGLSEGAADYIAAHIKRSDCDPSIRGQYWVIRGTGEEVTAGGTDLDKIALVPTLA